MEKLIVSQSMYQDKTVLILAGCMPSESSYLYSAFKNVCQTDVVYAQQSAQRRIDRLLALLGMGRISQNIEFANKTIIHAVEARPYDLICIEKGLTIWRGTIERIKKINTGCHVALWTWDDQALPHNQTSCFLEAASSYDIIFTTKSNNIKYGELEKIGFKRVEFIYQGFSPDHHYPIIKEGSPYNGQVIFIGYCERKRSDYINFLAKHGIKVHVYGNGWNHPRNILLRLKKHSNVIVHGKPLLGPKYADALSNSAICLGFLREINRDLHTSRTFEIPACKGFMLAERTEEHLNLYEEGKEAEFFESKEELLSKVQYYLDNPKQRELIAERGYQRTLKEDYSCKKMVQIMLERIFGQSPG